MKKQSKNLPSKSNLKHKKRLLRVLKAISMMEQHTAHIAASLYPMFQAMMDSRASTAMPTARPVSNKKKKDEFRENWLDKQDVIRLMPVSERSLYALRKGGQLPSYSFKGKIYFKLKDVENLMRSKDQGKVPAA